MGESIWPALSPDGKVLTHPYLQSANLVVQFIDSLGILFSPVSHDVSNNIKTIMSRFSQDRERFKYLNDLIDYELTKNSKRTAEALLWLNRGLLFISTFMEKLINDHNQGIDTESISSNLKSSYEATLAKYHGFMLRQLFVLLNAAAPSRKDLIQRLGQIIGVTEPETVMDRIKDFHSGLRINLNALLDFYRARNLFPET